MNTTPQPHDTVAEEQAALWAARLDGDNLDLAQRAELDAWLAQKPAHRALLSQYCQFSADLEEQVPALVAAGAVKMPESKPKRRWTFPRVSMVALAAAAAVAVTAVVMHPAQVENISTSSAQRRPYTLADGTRIELNANTSVRFENTGTQRRLNLAGGEALFMVAKDPQRPFTVETPTGSVRVTGTTFNVRTEASRHAFEVTVVEGSVQVRPSDAGSGKALAPMALSAGDRFTSAAGFQALGATKLDDVLAWRQGQIVFDDVPLSEALARFAQYHGRGIHVAPEAATQRVGGRHSLEDLDGFLAALEVALPVKVTRDPGGAVFVNATSR